MVVIEVQEKDLDAVFEILSNNGRFTGLENNKFRIDEHSADVLKKIKEEGIEVKLIDGEDGTCSEETKSEE
jgi:aminoglycoside/choline kinase family phosphotransferase